MKDPTAAMSEVGLIANRVSIRFQLRWIVEYSQCVCSRIYIRVINANTLLGGLYPPVTI